MKLIPITLKGARVESFSITLKEDGVPSFDATVVLLDQHDRRVTSIRVGSESYFGGCELSPQYAEAVGRLESVLEYMVTAHINKMNRSITMEEVME